MEYYSKVKTHIVSTYLNDDNLHTIKKEAIKKLLKQTECALIETNKQKNLKLKDEIKNGYVNQLITQAEQINKCDNLDVLENLNYFASFEDEDNNIFYETFIDIYFKLKAFKDSGIDESNYTKEIKSLEKKRNELQRFSSKIIELDKMPKHPSDIIVDIINENTSGEFAGMFSKNDILPIINSIVSSLKLRYKGVYKTKPHPTSLSKIQAEKCDGLIEYVHKMLNGQLSEDEQEAGAIQYSEVIQITTKSSSK